MINLNFFKRLFGAPTGTVTRAAYLDGCEFRINEERRTVEVFIPGTIVLVNIETNHRKKVKGEWLHVADVGHMWTEFEVYYPGDPAFQLYLGDSNSYSTAMAYSNLAYKLKDMKG